MIKGFFLSVCEAIDYMHSKNIMHRDIKVTNFLFSPKIFCWTEKIMLKCATSALPLIASPE
jgi:serine/threonine protein kinase